MDSYNGDASPLLDACSITIGGIAYKHDDIKSLYNTNLLHSQVVHNTVSIGDESTHGEYNNEQGDSDGGSGISDVVANTSKGVNAFYVARQGYNVSKNTHNNVEQSNEPTEQSSIDADTGLISKDVVNNGMSFELKTLGSEALHSAQGVYSDKDDIEAQSVGQFVNVGVGAYTVFRGAQAVSPYVVKGVYNIGDTSYKTTGTIYGTYNSFKGVNVPLDGNILTRLRTMSHITGLSKTPISQAVIKGVNTVRGKYNTVKNYAITTRRGAVKLYTALRGVVTGSNKIYISKDNIKTFRDVGIKSLRDSGKTIKNIGSAGLSTAKSVGVVSAQGALKGIKASAMVAANAALTNDNIGMQAMGASVVGTRYGIKTAKVASIATQKTVSSTIKGVQTAGNATANVYRGTRNAAAYFKHHGLAAAARHYRAKAAAAISNSGSSAVTTVVNGVKGVLRKVGMKFVVPLLLIISVICGTMASVTAPVSVIGTIFGASFTTAEGVDFEVRDYLIQPDKIPAYRASYISGLLSLCDSHSISNGGSYHYVRLYTNMLEDEIDATFAGISEEFHSEEQLLNIISPLFNAIILKDYGLDPSDDEAAAVASLLFDNLFRLNEAATIEWCGQDDDGSTYPHSCGNIYAHGDCPHINSGSHSSYTCSSCCYYYCPGHVSTDTDDVGNITTSTFYCSGCTHACSGYQYCAGHNVMSVTLSMDGVYELMYLYFLEPIEVLSNMAVRTEDEDILLQDLKDYYEICLEMISEVSLSFGGGMTMEDLSGVVWVLGSRVGNQAVIDLALLQVGQVGGQPYWSYYGFSSRVAWCACFVYWVMHNSGYGSYYATSSNNAYTPTLTAWFSSNGRWASRGFPDIVAGDAIFFDWDVNGRANHIGLVIGRDDTYVYTVEGNSSDSVRVKQYPLNSSVIMGYGLMNY